MGVDQGSETRLLRTTVFPLAYPPLYVNDVVSSELAESLSVLKSFILAVVHWHDALLHELHLREKEVDDQAVELPILLERLDDTYAGVTTLLHVNSALIRSILRDLYTFSAPRDAKDRLPATARRLHHALRTPDILLKHSSLYHTTVRRRVLRNKNVSRMASSAPNRRRYVSSSPSLSSRSGRFMGLSRRISPKVVSRILPATAQRKHGAEHGSSGSKRVEGQNVERSAGKKLVSHASYKGNIKAVKHEGTLQRSRAAGQLRRGVTPRARERSRETSSVPCLDHVEPDAAQASIESAVDTKPSDIVLNQLVEPPLRDNPLKTCTAPGENLAQHTAGSTERAASLVKGEMAGDISCRSDLPAGPRVTAAGSFTSVRTKCSNTDRDELRSRRSSNLLVPPSVTELLEGGLGRGDTKSKGAKGARRASESAVAGKAGTGKAKERRRKSSRVAKVDANDLQAAVPRTSRQFQSSKQSSVRSIQLRLPDTEGKHDKDPKAALPVKAGPVSGATRWDTASVMIPRRTYAEQEEMDSILGIVASGFWKRPKVKDNKRTPSPSCFEEAETGTCEGLISVTKKFSGDEDIPRTPVVVTTTPVRLNTRRYSSSLLNMCCLTLNVRDYWKSNNQ